MMSIKFHKPRLSLLNPKVLVSLVTATVLLTGCGGGGGGTTPTDTTQSAYLIDSAVEGIDYTCGTITGTTDSTGKFTYDSTKCPTGVEFKLGSLSLGTINPSAINTDTYLTLQDLAGVSRDNVTDENVVKLAVLLQSLDSDSNASNGIDINSTVRTNFSLTGNISDINDTALQTEIGSHGKAKKTRYEALKHLLDYTKSIDATVTTRLDNKSLLQTGQTACYSASDPSAAITCSDDANVLRDDGYYTWKGRGIARTFIRDDAKQIVTDTKTQLEWYDGTVPATMDWSTAGTYCTDLEFGGYTDWRLPTNEELTTIANKSAAIPAIFAEFQNTTVASYNYYWSSTTHASDTEYAWIVDFYFGANGEGWHDKATGSYYIRCVRGGQ